MIRTLKTATFVPLIVCLLLSGCRSSIQSNVDRVFTRRDWETAEAYRLETKYRDISKVMVQYQNAAPDPAGRKSIRDDTIRDLQWLTDYEYGIRKRDLYNGQNDVNFLGDVITLGLTAGSTITGGAPAKTVLSAIATAVVGVKTSVDTDFLHSQTVAAIIAQMDSERATALLPVINGLKESDSDYPLRQGMIDLVGYYDAGQIVTAITALDLNANKSNSDSQRTLRIAKAATQPTS